MIDTKFMKFRHSKKVSKGFTINPVSDLCARLKNALMAGLKVTEVIYSEFALNILKALKKDGYIVDYFRIDDEYIKMHDLPERAKYLIEVVLKYDNRGVPVIRNIRPISKSSRRIYASFRDFKPSEQYATLIVSTSNAGVLSHNDARREKLGGEVLLEVVS